jgi:hypothetical protein
MMKRPSIDDMNLASEWLDAYESGEADGLAMYRVAAWLREQADAAYLRETAKSNGVPVGKLRTGLQKLKAMNAAAPKAQSVPDFTNDAVGMNRNEPK